LPRGKGSSNAASKNNKSEKTKNTRARERGGGEREGGTISEQTERKKDVERESDSLFFLSPSLESFCYPRVLLTSRESLERKK